MNVLPERFSRAGLAPTEDWVHTVKIVGASLLAMDVNDDAGRLDERGVWAFFASKLAPTGGAHSLLISTTHQAER